MWGPLETHFGRKALKFQFGFPQFLGPLGYFGVPSNSSRGASPFPGWGVGSLPGPYKLLGCGLGVKGLEKSFFNPKKKNFGGGGQLLVKRGLLGPKGFQGGSQFPLKGSAFGRNFPEETLPFGVLKTFLGKNLWGLKGFGGHISFGTGFFPTQKGSRVKGFPIFNFFPFSQKGVPGIPFLGRGPFVFKFPFGGFLGRGF